MTWQQVANHCIDALFSGPVFWLLSIRMIVVIFAATAVRTLEK